MGPIQVSLKNRRVQLHSLHLSNAYPSRVFFARDCILEFSMKENFRKFVEGNLNKSVKN